MRHTDEQPGAEDAETAAGDTAPLIGGPPAYRRPRPDELHANARVVISTVRLSCPCGAGAACADYQYGAAVRASAGRLAINDAGRRSRTSAVRALWRALTTARRYGVATPQLLVDLAVAYPYGTDSDLRAVTLPAESS